MYYLFLIAGSFVASFLILLFIFYVVFPFLNGDSIIDDMLPKNKREYYLVVDSSHQGKRYLDPEVIFSNIGKTVKWEYGNLKTFSLSTTRQNGFSVYNENTVPFQNEKSKFRLFRVLDKGGNYSYRAFSPWLYPTGKIKILEELSWRSLFGNEQHIIIDEFLKTFSNTTVEQIKQYIENEKVIDKKNSIFSNKITETRYVVKSRINSLTSRENYLKSIFFPKGTYFPNEIFLQDSSNVRNFIESYFFLDENGNPKENISSFINGLSSEDYEYFCKAYNNSAIAVIYRRLLSKEEFSILISSFENIFGRFPDHYLLSDFEFEERQELIRREKRKYLEKKIFSRF